MGGGGLHTNYWLYFHTSASLLLLLPSQPSKYLYTAIISALTSNPALNHFPAFHCLSAPAIPMLHWCRAVQSTTAAAVAV